MSAVNMRPEWRRELQNLEKIRDHIIKMQSLYQIRKSELELQMLEAGELKGDALAIMEREDGGYGNVVPIDKERKRA